LYTVRVETGFFAYHQVKESNGQLEPLHSHDWQVAVEVTGQHVNKEGMLIDFGFLKTTVDNITSEINDKQMGRIDFFKWNSSSTENVARYIYEKLESLLPQDVKLSNVSVTEQPGCSVRYSC
jgi:6-pyruvoyltetrahydropterin/6-carboxytetrahydropterin synthase